MNTFNIERLHINETVNIGVALETEPDSVKRIIRVVYTPTTMSTVHKRDGFVESFLDGRLLGNHRIGTYFLIQFYNSRYFTL